MSFRCSTRTNCAATAVCRHTAARFSISAGATWTKISCITSIGRSVRDVMVTEGAFLLNESQDLTHGLKDEEADSGSKLDKIPDRRYPAE